MLSLVLVFALSGCGTSSASGGDSGASEDGSGDATTTRTVTDLQGTDVEIPNHVTKIAAAYPAVDEIFLLLGSEDQVCAINQYNQSNEWLLKLAPSLKELPTLFDSSGKFDAETLLSINPDVVVCGSEEVAEAVRAQGIPAVVAMAISVDSLKQTISLIGEILGADDRASDLVSYYEDNMKQATDRTSDLSADQRPKVYYATGNGPLNTEGTGSIVTDWMTMAGGTNVAADNGIDGMFKDVTTEQLLAWNPDIIITVNNKVRDEFLSDSAYADLTAVKNGAVYASPSGAYTWCVRSADEATMTLWAATKIQPDLFSDIDYDAITKDFYTQFYNYELTDDEVDDILDGN